MRGCLDGQRLSTSRVSLTSSGALTHCLHLNFNFNTLSQPACATTSVRHTFTTQPSVHLFSPPPTQCGNFNHGPATLWPLHTLRRHRSQRQMCDDVRCEPCTQWVVHTMRALGGIRFVQLVASQPSESTSAIHCDGPHHPTTRHYSLELLLAQHTVRKPTICNTRWCHHHFWHVVHPMHWYTNCDGLDTSVYRGVYDMSIACSTFWTTL